MPRAKYVHLPRRRPYRGPWGPKLSSEDDLSPERAPSPPPICPNPTALNPDLPTPTANPTPICPDPPTSDQSPPPTVEPDSPCDDRQECERLRRRVLPHYYYRRCLIISTQIGRFTSPTPCAPFLWRLLPTEVPRRHLRRRRTWTKWKSAHTWYSTGWRRGGTCRGVAGVMAGVMASRLSALHVQGNPVISNPLLSFVHYMLVSCGICG